MKNFTEQESSALLYLKLARDLGADSVNINKSTCEVIVNLVERLMKEKEDLKTHNKILSQKRVNMYERLEIYQQAKKRVREELLSEIKETDGIGNWISVKDRLPTNSDRVLVCYHNFKLKLSITYIDSYNGFGEWEEFDKCYGKKAWKVTHWQPLPNEPKIEGD